MVKQKVLCFGELLLRLSPALNGSWIKNASMPVYIGGAELNAASALAKWGIPVTYCTALPANYLSKEICADLKEKNIDAEQIIFSGERMGTYYLPQGADLKNAGVIYDRANSSFSELETGKIDWDNILRDKTWFHFSAISPALNQNVADVCKEALEAASSKGITISVDLNYRNKLWKYGHQPIEIMPSLAEHCDLIMGNIWAANTLLGIELDNDISIKNNKAAYLDHAKKTSRQIMRQFPKCKSVANTFRFDNEKGLSYYASLDIAEEQFVSKEFSTDMVIDKVGSGDCFMAGLIYGNVLQHNPQQIIDFASAAAFNKLFIRGDATTSAVEEIKNTFANA